MTVFRTLSGVDNGSAPAYFWRDRNTFRIHNLSFGLPYYVEFIEHAQRKYSGGEGDMAAESADVKKRHTIQ